MPFLDVLTHRNFSGFVKLADLHTDNFSYDTMLMWRFTLRFIREEINTHTRYVYKLMSIMAHLSHLWQLRVLKHFMSPRCAQHRMLKDLLIITAIALLLCKDCSFIHHSKNVVKVCIILYIFNNIWIVSKAV